MPELWEYPVEVQRDGSNGRRCVRNSRDAIASLSTDFPKGGKEAKQARKICLSALEGRSDTESAAAAFRTAAEAAGIL